MSKLRNGGKGSEETGISNGDPGIRSALAVDGGEQLIGGIVDGGPRHGRDTTRRLEKDVGEDGGAGGVVCISDNVISLESLGGPYELGRVPQEKGGTRDVGEVRGIVVPSPGRTGQDNDATKVLANLDADEAGVVRSVSGNIPGRDSPISTTTGGGGAPLKNGL